MVVSEVDLEYQGCGLLGKTGVKSKEKANVDKRSGGGTASDPEA
jgi:hypothetical protein